MCSWFKSMAYRIVLKIVCACVCVCVCVRIRLIAIDDDDDVYWGNTCRFEWTDHLDSLQLSSQSVFHHSYTVTVHIHSKSKTRTFVQHYLSNKCAFVCVCANGDPLFSPSMAPYVHLIGFMMDRPKRKLLWKRTKWKKRAIRNRMDKQYQIEKLYLGDDVSDNKTMNWTTNM